MTRAAVFKVNISTIIAWRGRYEATGDVKTKVRYPVNKKIIPEKHDLFDNIWERLLKSTSKKSQKSSAVIHLQR